MPCSDACASERNEYVAFRRVTVHFATPLKAMPVFLFTPGPVRWKSSFALRSLIVIVALPTLALCANVIFAPGPTRAVSCCVFDGGVVVVVVVVAALVVGAAPSSYVE